MQQKDSGFLDKPVIEIYKSLGEKYTIFPSRLLESREQNVWDYIVDRGIKNQTRNIKFSDWNDHPNGFSSPLILNLFLCNTTDPELSFFKSLVLSRDIKRAKQFKVYYKGKSIDDESDNEFH